MHSKTEQYLEKHGFYVEFKFNVLVLHFRVLNTNIYL